MSNPLEVYRTEIEGYMLAVRDSADPFGASRLERSYYEKLRWCGHWTMGEFNDSITQMRQSIRAEWGNSGVQEEHETGSISLMGDLSRLRDEIER